MTSHATGTRPTLTWTLRGDKNSLPTGSWLSVRVTYKTAALAQSPTASRLDQLSSSFAFSTAHEHLQTLPPGAHSLFASVILIQPSQRDRTLTSLTVVEQGSHYTVSFNKGADGNLEVSLAANSQ